MTSPVEEKTGVYANATAIKQNMTSGGNLAFHNFNNDFAHISNANERRRLALAEIDKAPFGWYHVRAIAVAGVSVGCDDDDIDRGDAGYEEHIADWWRNTDWVLHR